MKVKDILDRVTTLYHDIDYVRVPESHYLKFLDDTLTQLVLSRPDSHVKTSIVKLSKGTKQELPEDGFTLIDIYMNKSLTEGEYNTDSAVYSDYRPVTHVRKEDLDYFSDWHSSKEEYDHIKEFAYDAKDPRTFWVTPAVNTTDVYVQMSYSYGFERLGDLSFKEAITKELDVSDIFVGPITAYMLYLLYSTDSTSPHDRQIATTYLQSFYQSLGMEYNANMLVAPVVPDIQNKQGVVNAQ